MFNNRVFFSDPCGRPTDGEGPPEHGGHIPRGHHPGVRGPDGRRTGPTGGAGTRQQDQRHRLRARG